MWNSPKAGETDIPSLLYLTFTLPPEPGATKRPLRQAALLAELGHRVTILTTMPNYPHGRVFPGYRGRLYMRETMEGVDVVRVWSLPSANRGRVLRTLSLISFLVTAVLAGLVLRRRDIVIGSVTNPLVETAAFLLSRMKGCALVYEIRDLVPDNLFQANVLRSRRLVRILDRYYSWLWRKAALIAVVHESIAAALRARGVDAGKLVLLPHGIDFDRLARADRVRSRAELGVSDMFVAVYSGSLSPQYHIPDLVDAATALKDRANFKLLIIGTGPDAARAASKAQRLPQGFAVMAGAKSPDEAELLAAVGDVFIDSSDTLAQWQTTKSIEYLAYGRPIVVCRPDSRTDQEFSALAIGKAVVIGDGQAFARAIGFYMDNPDEYAKTCDAARRVGRQQFDRRVLVNRFHLALLACVQDAKDSA